MKIRFFRSLGFYLFLTLLLFAFVPLAIFQVTANTRARRELGQNTEKQIRQITTTAQRLFEERIENEKAGLAFLARMPALSKEFLSHYFYQYNDIYYRVSLLDTDGDPYITLVSNFDPQHLFPLPFEERVDLPGIPQQKLPPDDRIHALDIYPIPDGYALPLIGKSGDNYILADIRLSVFFSRIEPFLGLSGKDQFMVADQRGAVIYSRKPEILNQSLIIPPGRFIREKASTTGFSGNGGLGFGLKRDYQSLIDSINHSTRLNLSLGLGGMLLIFFLAYIFVKPLTSPLSQLVKAADGIAGGDFDWKTSIRHPEEFKILGDRFNRMADELKALLEEKSRTQSFAAIGKFASYFAHDIKSPLEGTYLIASEIQKNMSSNDPQRENMDELIKGVTRLRELVNSSLDFARINNPRIENLDINNLIEQKANEFSEQYPCRMELNLEPVMEEVRLDPVLFSRVLDNLFHNSWEASAGDRVIRVTTAREDSHVFIRIEDEGRGIPAGLSEKIFEPFFSSKKKGYGFGLAFVQEVIRKHGGRIMVHSQEEKGTEMILIFPSEKTNVEV